jgi:hypothetical protein
MVWEERLLGGSAQAMTGSSQPKLLGQTSDCAVLRLVSTLGNHVPFYLQETQSGQIKDEERAAEMDCSRRRAVADSLADRG